MLDAENPYERLRLVNKSQNQEILDNVEDGFGTLSNPTSPSPFEKLKTVNKSQYQEYLKYANLRDKTKANAAAFFQYGPRLMQFVVIIIVIFASAAYIAVLLKL